MTDASKPSDGNRAKGKDIDADHTAAAPARTQTAKLADLISNSLSIGIYDPDFARDYLSEKERLLHLLTKGEPALLAAAWKAHAFARDIERMCRK